MFYLKQNVWYLGTFTNQKDPFLGYQLCHVIDSKKLWFVKTL